MHNSDSFETARIYFLNGLNKLNLNNFIGAKIDFETSLKFAPNRITTLINLSIVLIKLKDFESAEQIIIDSLVLYPNNKELLMGLVEIYENLISQNSDHTEAYLKLGNCFNKLCMYDESFAAYNTAISLNPNIEAINKNRESLLVEIAQYKEEFANNVNYIETKIDFASLYLEHGNILKELNRLDEAISSYDRAIEIYPSFNQAYSNRGIALKELNRLEESISSYDKAIEIYPDDAEVLSNRGIALRELKRFDDSLASFNQAIEINPIYFDAYSNRGNVLKELNRLDEALNSYNQAIQINPNYAEAYYNLGVYFSDFDLFDQALASYDQAIKINPNYALAYSNRGNVLKELNCFQDSLASYEKAIKLKPDYVEAYSNLGIMLNELKRFNESLASYNKAIELNPNYAEAYFNKSILLLSLQDFKNGWQLYDWRWKKSDSSLPMNMMKPKLVNLQSRYGGFKKLLIWAEQGVGDQILYSSMLNQLFNIVPSSQIMLDKRLLPLFERSLPQGRFIDKTTTTDEIEYDEHLPIADLGKYFRSCSADFINSQNPFLKADQSKSDIFRSTLIGGNKYLCGITWSSKIKKLGSEKSIHLEDLLPILTMTNITFVSLQYGDVHEQVIDFNKKYGLNIKECFAVDNFNDLDGHASLIQACDFVVTISNTSAHISGAIGKETFLMCPSGKGLMWYWSNRLNGKSMWYPSIHIYEQTLIGIWTDVINKIKLVIEDKIIR